MEHRGEVAAARARQADERRLEGGAPEDHGGGEGVEREGPRAAVVSGQPGAFDVLEGERVAGGRGGDLGATGGVRLEDIVLVTETGVDVLTDYPYDLEP